LAPGVYTVSGSAQSTIGGLQPGMVRAVAGQTRNVNFLIDTGIR